MLIYVNLCKLKNLGIATKNTSVGDLVEKLEHFIGFDFNYFNLC